MMSRIPPIRVIVETVDVSEQQSVDIDLGIRDVSEFGDESSFERVGDGTQEG